MPDGHPFGLLAALQLLEPSYGINELGLRFVITYSKQCYVDMLQLPS